MSEKECIYGKKIICFGATVKCKKGTYPYSNNHRGQMAVAKGDKGRPGYCEVATPWKKIDKEGLKAELDKLQYNLVRPHQSLGSTPAQAGKINLPFEDGWGNLIDWATYHKTLANAN